MREVEDVQEMVYIDKKGLSEIQKLTTKRMRELKKKIKRTMELAGIHQRHRI